MSEFEKVAFELEPSTTNNPKWGECKTSEGYHIIVSQLQSSVFVYGACANKRFVDGRRAEVGLWVWHGLDVFHLSHSDEYECRQSPSSSSLKSSQLSPCLSKRCLGGFFIASCGAFSIATCLFRAFLSL